MKQYISFFILFVYTHAILPGITRTELKKKLNIPEEVDIKIGLQSTRLCPELAGNALYNFCVEKSNDIATQRLRTAYQYRNTDPYKATILINITLYCHYQLFQDNAWLEQMRQTWQTYYHDSFDNFIQNLPSYIDIELVKKRDQEYKVILTQQELVKRQKMIEELEADQCSVQNYLATEIKKEKEFQQNTLKKQKDAQESYAQHLKHLEEAKKKMERTRKNTMYGLLFLKGAAWVLAIASGGYYCFHHFLPTVEVEVQSEAA